MVQLPVALQMYTLRDDAAKDFAGTIRRVAAMGYAGVELAGTGNLSARDLRALLEDNNLQIVGAHVPLGALEGDLGATTAYHQELGTPYVVCPFLPKERQTAEGYAQVAVLLNTVGARLRDAGLQLAYHNHAFEFEPLAGTPGNGGTRGYDLLIDGTDPELVKIELDTFWVQRAGLDPAQTLRRYANRVPLIHLKDMTPGDQPTFAEVGEGIMDFGAIFAAAEVAGGKFYIVEQDVCERPPLESVRISLDNLRNMGIA